MKNRIPLTLLASAGAMLLAVGCATHQKHAESHTHGTNCGHVAIVHEGHADYLHDGHLHHSHGSHADEHRLSITAENPDVCTPDHECPAHLVGHAHGTGCGHEAIPHGDHTDYLVANHLHHSHDGHCDLHGATRQR